MRSLNNSKISVFKKLHSEVLGRREFWGEDTVQTSAGAMCTLLCLRNGEWAVFLALTPEEHVLMG